MKETLGQLLMQVRGAWRFRWHALLAAWAIAIVGWAIAVGLPNEYEARARVYVDTDSVLKPLLSGLAVNTDEKSRVTMMARVIMGTTNLERVARETGLANRVHTPESFQELIDSLGKEIKVDGSDNIFTITYRDHDPTMAQRVVQHLLDAFEEDTLGIKRADSGSAQQFLEAQIHDYESRLRASEDQLANFQRQNVGLLPGQQSGDYFTRLQSENGKLQDMQARLRVLLDRRTELQKQLDGEEPTFGLFSSNTGSGDSSTAAIDAEIVEDRREIAQLLLQYTEKHPRVIALRARIAQLESQKAAALKAPPKKPASGMPALTDPSQAANYALDLNPVYQNLRIELSQTDVNMAELREQIAEETRVVNDLKSRVNAIPVVEAQYAQLNRDYAVTKAQYDQLLQRLDSAKLSEQAEANTDQVKFRIIEPPVVPLVPAGPNRLLFITLALLAALAGGIGLAVLLNEMKPVFLSRAMLAGVTGLPVLGSVSFLSSAVTRRLLRRKALLVAAGGAFLLVAYTLAMVLAGPVTKVAQQLLGSRIA